MSGIVVLASTNRKKLEELSALLDGLPVQLRTMIDLGVEPPPETASTFVENALEKARHASTVTGLPAIADDSGLSVAALQGQPGVRSARFAGENATDLQNNQKLIRLLRVTPEDSQDRSAMFVSCLVYLFSASDPVPTLASAFWHGQIVDTPRGSNGFGYDPHFLVEGTRQTAAELSFEEKNRISHRAKAAREFRSALRTRLGQEQPIDQGSVYTDDHSSA